MQSDKGIRRKSKLLSRNISFKMSKIAEHVLGTILLIVLFPTIKIHIRDSNVSPLARYM